MSSLPSSEVLKSLSNLLLMELVLWLEVLCALCLKVLA